MIATKKPGVLCSRFFHFKRSPFCLFFGIFGAGGVGTERVWLGSPFEPAIVLFGQISQQAIGRIEFTPLDPFFQ